MFRGEIWSTNLEPTIGAEMRKTRPVVIINNNEAGILPLRIVVPITDWKIRYENIAWMVKIEPDETNKLSKISAIDAFQIRCLSEQRFVRKIGRISQEILDEVTTALAEVLQIK
jgi:mRNA interferase MazF